MGEIDTRRRDLGGCRDGDDVVEAHDDVGDGDDAHRAPEIARAFHATFFAVSVLGDELDRHIEQQQASDELEVGVIHRLRDDEGEDDAKQHSNAGAEDHAPEPLPRRQRHASHRDDDGVVARENDVDADDLKRRDPERRVHHVLPQKIHRATPSYDRRCSAALPLSPGRGRGVA